MKDDKKHLVTNQEAIEGIALAIQFAKDHQIRTKIVYLLKYSSKAHDTEKEGVRMMPLAGSGVVIAADLLGKVYKGRVWAVFYPATESGAIVCFRHEDNKIVIFRSGLWVAKLDDEYDYQNYISDNTHVARYLYKFKPLGG